MPFPPWTLCLEHSPRLVSIRPRASALIASSGGPLLPQAPMALCVSLSECHWIHSCAEAQIRRASQSLLCLHWWLIKGGVASDICPRTGKPALLADSGLWVEKA